MFLKSAILEIMKSNIKEVITNVVVDNLVSCEANLEDVKVEFDMQNPNIIHVTLPNIVTNEIQK